LALAASAPANASVKYQQKAPIEHGVGRHGDLCLNLLQGGAKLATFFQLFHDVQTAHQLAVYKLQQKK
jgi:hypothetical protein